MNRSCLLSLAVCRTPLNPCVTRIPLCVGLVLNRAMFSLACALPSPTCAENRSSLFGWFTGNTAQSNSSGTYPPCGFSPARIDLDPGWPSWPGWKKMFPRSPGSRACCFSACLGSLTTQDQLTARV